MVVEISHNQLEEHIKRNKQVGQPLMVWGSIGIGKSQKVEETARQTTPDGREFVKWNEIGKEKKEKVKENPGDYHVFIDIRLSQYDPTDIKGLPDLDGDEVVWKIMSWAKFITNEEASGVVFFDEVNLAPPSVQAAFYQLVLKSEISEYSVSDDVYVLAAGNRAGKDRANVYEMAGPLRDRFNHVELLSPRGGPQGNWTNWAIENGLDEKVISFISSPMGEGKLHTFDDDKDAKVFATPRSWEKASDLIEGLEDRRLMESLLSTVVGQGIASEFKGFLELRDEVDIDSILENPKRVMSVGNGKENKMDLKYSVISGLAARYKEDTSVLNKLVDVSKWLYENSDAEFSILLLRLASQYHKRHFVKNVVDTDSWVSMRDKFDEYIDQSRGGGK